MLISHRSSFNPCETHVIRRMSPSVAHRYTASLPTQWALLYILPCQQCHCQCHPMHPSFTLHAQFGLTHFTLVQPSLTPLEFVMVKVSCSGFFNRQMCVFDCHTLIALSSSKHHHNQDGGQGGTGLSGQVLMPCLHGSLC